MYINIHRQIEESGFNIEHEESTDGIEQVFIHTRAGFYISLSLKEADELCDKLSHVLMDLSFKKFAGNSKLSN